MKGNMTECAPTIPWLLRHARLHHGKQEIVSITHDHTRHHCTFAELFDRAAQLSNALERLGAKRGDVIGTLAWNDYRHMEVYYATASAGIICHTINPRLFPEQLAYIIGHAEDKWLFIDPMFIPLAEALQPHIGNVKGFIVLGGKDAVPESSLPNLVAYEELISGEDTSYIGPELDENDACALCYTSGTTGNPKGVLYSHKAIVLQCYAGCQADTMGLNRLESVLAIVPMFHVQAWNLPYSAALAGFKLVFPGSSMGDPEVLQALIEEEKVSFAAGVPTVWLSLLNYLRESGKAVSTLERVVVGGSACPLSIMEEFENQHGVLTQSGWGMTELAPMGTYNSLNKPRDAYDDEEFALQRVRAGRAIFGIELKIVDDNDQELPWDGVAFGTLKVRGPWVIERYYKSDTSALDENGWFDTGDVATIDDDGYMAITDRTKDVIKSGGEWISSIDLENCAVGHPAVAEAAVIGIAHPKWDERPLLIVVKAEGQELNEQDILDYMKDKVAKWWLPDAIRFVDEIPHTATGKIQKVELRQQFADFTFENSP